MVTCLGCSGEYEAGELCRHENPGFVLVHRPECERTLGTYSGWR